MKLTRRKFVNLGWSAAEPQVTIPEILPARGAGESLSELRLSPAPRAGVIFNRRFLGFRYAPPQTLCCRPLRGLHRTDAKVVTLMNLRMRLGWELLYAPTYYS